MAESSIGLIKRHLLGESSLEERLQVEKRLPDEDFSIEYDLAEDDLIADYYAGRLSEKERNLFENYYMKLPGSAGKISMTRNIFEAFEKSAAFYPPDAARQPDTAAALKHAFGWLPKLKFAAFALAGILLSAVLFSVYEKQTELQAELNDVKEQLKTAQSNPPLQAQPENAELIKQTEEQKNVNGTLMQQNNKDQKKRRTFPARNSPQTEEKNSGKIPALPYPDVARINLLPDSAQMSTGNKPKVLQIGRQTKQIIITLSLPENPSFDSYSAEIEQGNRELKVYDNLTAAGKTLTLKVRSENLASGGAVITLYGVDKESGRRATSAYKLRIIKNY